MDIRDLVDEALYHAHCTVRRPKVIIRLPVEQAWLLLVEPMYGAVQDYREMTYRGVPVYLDRTLHNTARVEYPNGNRMEVVEIALSEEAAKHPPAPYYGGGPRDRF